MQKPELRLENFKILKQIHPVKQLANSNKTALAVFECLLNNDPYGAMEMIELYLEAINKTKLRAKTGLSKSTMFSALKHKNPTIKTLAKILSKSGI